MKRIYSDASHDEMPDQDHCAFIDDHVRAWRRLFGHHVSRFCWLYKPCISWASFREKTAILF